MSEYKIEPKSPTKIRLLDPVVYETSLPGCDDLCLSPEEVVQFKTEGFVVKRGLVPPQADFDQVIDHVWDAVPNDAMSRDKPHTWLDEPHTKWTPEDAQRVGVLHRGMWKVRSPGGYGTEKFLTDLTANHQAVLSVAEQLCGPTILKSNRVRGIYVVLPKPPEVNGGLGPHADHAACQLSAMVLVDDVKPRCGGFTIWPKSHEALHPYWETTQSAHYADPEGFAKVRAEILNTVAPLEFVGHRGDVVFWHPRLLHSAGVNYSAETVSPCVRYVVPCDFQKAGYTYYDDEVYGPGDKEQWWVDTRHFREDVPATPENLWHDWAI